MPEPKPRGKKRQACDSCARAKKACYHYVPYLEDNQENGSPAPSLSPLILPGGEAIKEKQVADLSLDMAKPDDSTNMRISVPFLLNYTRPGSDILTDVFGAHTSPPLPVASSLDTDRNIPESGPTFLDELGYFMSSSKVPVLDEYLCDGVPEAPLTHISAVRRAQLELRLTELVSQLTTVHQSLSRRNEGQIRPFTPAFGEMLFTVPNLFDFIDLYFKRLPPECNAMHQPSFEVEAVSLPVLLIMFLVGATYSSPRDTASMARECFDLAEEFIFEHSDFKSVLNGERTASTQTKRTLRVSSPH
jgi:hypothetical protein